MHVWKNFVARTYTYSIFAEISKMMKVLGFSGVKFRNFSIRPKRPLLHGFRGCWIQIRRQNWLARFSQVLGIIFIPNWGLSREWLLIRVRQWHHYVSRQILPKITLFLPKFLNDRKWRKMQEFVYEFFWSQISKIFDSDKTSAKGLFGAAKSESAIKIGLGWFSVTLIRSQS